MNIQARRIAQGLAAARKAAQIDNAPYSDVQFELMVDQMALACSDNAIGPFNYDAFCTVAYGRAP